MASRAFKRLAHNDTGSARGHQAGVLIPKDLASHFPHLSGVVNPAAPTIDQAIDAELVVDGKVVGTTTTRYQHQTWGATRRAERRVTKNLQPLLASAKKGDLLVIEQQPGTPLSYRFMLHRQGTAGYSSLSSLVGPRRWGTI